MAEPITCLIVDDHEVVREGLRLALSRTDNIRVIGEASRRQRRSRARRRRRPNVIIMDVRMPGVDGLRPPGRSAREVPEASVLMFTAYGERSLLTRGLEAGAKGYILKEAPHQTLVRAIQKVAGGDGYVDPALMAAFLTKEREDMLTARERRSFSSCPTACPCGRCRKLFISQETVKSHVRHILSKLEADTRTHAVAIALRQAIID